MFPWQLIPAAKLTHSHWKSRVAGALGCATPGQWEAPQGHGARGDAQRTAGSAAPRGRDASVLCSSAPGVPTARSPERSLPPMGHLCPSPSLHWYIGPRCKGPALGDWAGGSSSAPIQSAELLSPRCGHLGSRSHSRRPAHGPVQREAGSSAQSRLCLQGLCKAWEPCQAWSSPKGL